MTKTNIIEHKKKRLEQQKNRLKEQEALLKQLERKARTRKLIELGGLLLKAQLDEVFTNALYGGLLFLKEQFEKDSAFKKKCEQIGGAAFNAEKSDKVAVLVTFKEKPAEDIRLKIRDLGLKWNAIRKEWHGHVSLESLKDSLKGTDAHITEVA